MKNSFLWMIGLALVPLFGAQNGEQIYMGKGCYGCHGTRGEGIGDYPRLAGRSRAELMRLLEQLKKGIGHTSKREMMIPFAKALDKAQMEAVTRYLSAQNPHAEEDESLETPEDILGGSDM
ncbi:c-type cytochrome [Hydrogenimonas urashimensis]|uniref:c-type cytochrome n=1 Tax=Hydrogenimonas urashimensis TaxID=2740515 RepID=UPI001914F4FC|nr:c-type cytochrome [Hydrogenimonas urashimensis]